MVDDAAMVVFVVVAVAVVVVFVVVEADFFGNICVATQNRRNLPERFPSAGTKPRFARNYPLSTSTLSSDN